MRQAYFNGARQAVRLARECEREAGQHDGAWRTNLLLEAARHRERAAWYLMMRKRIVPTPQQMDLAA